MLRNHQRSCSLLSLVEMYSGGGDFTANIDSKGGEDTAANVDEAIKVKLYS